MKRRPTRVRDTYTAFGGCGLIAGVAFLVWAVVTDAPRAEAALPVGFGGAIGVVLGARLSTSRWNRAQVEPGAVASRPAWQTAAFSVLVLVVYGAWAVVVPDVRWVFAGAFGAGGLAMFVAAGQATRWEQRHRAKLLQRRKRGFGVEYLRTPLEDEAVRPEVPGAF